MAALAFIPVVFEIIGNWSSFSALYNPIACPTPLTFAMHFALYASALARVRLGTRIEISRAMMAMTTNSSISVKPFVRRMMRPPYPLGCIYANRSCRRARNRNDQSRNSYFVRARTGLLHDLAGLSNRPDSFNTSRTPLDRDTQLHRT